MRVRKWLSGLRQKWTDASLMAKTLLRIQKTLDTAEAEKRFTRLAVNALNSQGEEHHRKYEELKRTGKAALDVADELILKLTADLGQLEKDLATAQAERDAYHERLTELRAHLAERIEAAEIYERYMSDAAWRISELKDRLAGYLQIKNDHIRELTAELGEAINYRHIRERERELIIVEKIGALITAMGINPPGDDALANWNEVCSHAANAREELATAQADRDGYAAELAELRDKS